MKSFYRRHLPHWHPEGQIFFVTFRVYGSLPKQVIEKLKRKRDALKSEPPRPDESPGEKALRESKKMFALMDEALVSKSAGNNYLKKPLLASMIEDAIVHWDEKRYILHRYVIMPNHVHLLIEPLTKEENGNPFSLGKIMQGIKGYTARKANRFLGRSGKFWQDESFDHWVRDRREYLRIRQYIDMNPVKAGLCEKPSRWPWSSA